MVGEGERNLASPVRSRTLIRPKLLRWLPVSGQTPLGVGIWTGEVVAGRAGVGLPKATGLRVVVWEPIAGMEEGGVER